MRSALEINSPDGVSSGSAANGSRHIVTIELGSDLTSNVKSHALPKLESPRLSDAITLYERHGKVTEFSVNR